MITQYRAVSSLDGKNEIDTHANAQNEHKTIQALCHMSLIIQAVAAQQKDHNE
jgi:hypothetical protein